MSLFGTDGIRDVAGQGRLSDESLTRIGATIARLLREKPELFHGTLPRNFPLRSKRPASQVVIGTDSRRSGPWIRKKLSRELLRFGFTVLDAGVLPTPGIAYLTRTWRCALGISISASHNPARDNGIKLLSPEGFKISDRAEEEIERGLETLSSGTRSGCYKRRWREARQRYLSFLTPRWRLPIRVVVDCANGAASPIAPSLFRRVCRTVVPIHAGPTGNNINHRCGALYPQKLARVVRKQKADLGVAFDGDADRALFVDETGAVRDGDDVLALCAERMKAGRVVSTIMANFGLEQYFEKRGIQLLRTQVGDKFVADTMIRRDISLGGEPSGHVIFLDTSTTGDGLLTAIKVLEVMKSRSIPFSKLCADLKKCPQILLNIPVRKKPPLNRVGPVSRALRSVKARLRNRGRVVLRYSGTEPLCRVMVEGFDKRLVLSQARELASAVRSALGSPS